MREVNDAMIGNILSKYCNASGVFKAIKEISIHKVYKVGGKGTRVVENKNEKKQFKKKMRIIITSTLVIKGEIFCKPIPQSRMQWSKSICKDVHQ